MSKILILSGLYPPGISGGSQLCKNIAEGLRNRGHNVYVAPLADRMTGRDFQNGVNIIRLPLRANLASKATGFLANHLRNRRMLYYNHCVNASLQIKAVEELVNEIHPDTLITVCYPFFAHIIGNRMKKRYPHIRWIAYYIDPFFSDEQNIKQWDKYVQIKEIDIISTADRIVMLEWMVGDYKKYLPEERLFPSYIPLYIDESISKEPIQKPDKKLTFLYCGTLYKGIREPYYLFELFEKYSEYKHDNCNVIIIGKKIGYSTEEIEEWKGQYHDVISFKDPVPHDRLKEYFEEASILVSVGNTTVNQMPSKIFEYVAMGKPILHIFKAEACPVRKLLEDYPLALCISEKEVIDVRLLKTIKLFSEGTRGKRVSEEQLRKKFNKYLIDNIVQVFEE